MGNFMAYNINTVMEMPYCHFIDLYALAEKREVMASNAIYIGHAMRYDDNIRSNNLSVLGGRLKSKRVFKTIVNSNAKKRAEMFAKSKVI